jgi:hypothetical protein
MDNGGHMPSQSQWAKLNEFLLQVGSFDDPIAFCVNAIRRLRNVVSFDEGRVYFMDSDGQVFDEYLLGVSKKVTKAYHEYYGELGGRRYSVTKRVKDEEQRLRLNDANDEMPKGMRVKRQRIVVMDWAKEPHDTRFYREYVAPLGLTFSTGFQLFDVDGNTRALFCLDRTRPVDYSSDERALLSLAATHLDNMYRKIFLRVCQSGCTFPRKSAPAPPFAQEELGPYSAASFVRRKSPRTVSRSPTRLARRAQLQAAHLWLCHNVTRGFTS